MSCLMLCRELEAQVQDLREVCKTSAADRAASQHASPDVQPPLPRSTIQLPTSGPVVIPGKLVSVTAHDSSHQSLNSTVRSPAPSDHDVTVSTS